MRSATIKRDKERETTSEYLQLQTQFKNIDNLVKALEEINPKWKGKIEIHNTPSTLYGYHGDARPEKANVIIRRQQVGAYSNDIGFVREADGTYKAIISEYDRGQGYNAAWLGKLKQRYAVAVTKRVQLLRGYRVVSEKVRANGAVELLLEI